MSQSGGERDALSELRHAIANPLMALLGEAQLLLYSTTPMDEEMRTGLKAIEAQALRIREVLKESQKRQ